MLIVSISAFCLVAIILLECIFRKSDFFSPIRVYFFFQSLALGVTFLALDKKMTPFQPFTSLVYFGSAVCFLLGVWVVYLLAGFPNKKSTRKVDFKQYNWKVHFFFAVALFILFVWGMLTAYHGTGLFPLLAKDKTKAIQTFFSYRWSSSIALSYGGLTMVLFFISIFRPRRFLKVFDPAFWAMVASILIFSLALSRAGLMFFAAFAIVFYNYAIRRFSILRLFIFFILCSAFIIVTGYLKVNGVQKEYNVRVKTSKVIQLALKVPYMYFANNFWNLDYALNPENYQERHPTTYGFTTVSGILDMMDFPGGNVGISFREGTGFEDQFHKQSSKFRGWNTVGYQWDLYKDFGVAGVFAGPFFIGMLFGVLYLRVIGRPTILNSAVYSYLTFFLSGTFGGYFPENAIYVYGFFYLCLCCFWSQSTFSGNLPIISTATPALSEPS